LDRTWKLLGSRILGRFPIFTVRADRSVSPSTGYEKEWTILEASDWVNVIPVTPEGRILLIRQFRPGTRELTIEIPGGAVDPEDRDTEAAARRELREETGCEADRFELLGTVTPNPATQTNRCHTYLASGARHLAEQSLDPGEEIEVFEADPNDVREMLLDGRITHALVVAAFHWLALRRDGKPER
jgi:8-oxo-dGTP pyrophosphatase MutT (NUDIX family)